MQPTSDHDSALGLVLLNQARAAIAEKLNTVAPPILEHPTLDQPGTTFVTLKQHGTLRGCIDHLEATRSLRRDVRKNAVAAACRDPRFPPLSIAEWAVIKLEVSLLGTITMQPCTSEADALALIVPGVDGVVLTSGHHRATFLPQVWENWPQADNFLAQLRLKAGLQQAWPANMMLGRYRVTKFVE